MQISQLPASASFSASDVVAIEINGVTYKATAATLGLTTRVYPVRGAIIKSASGTGTTIGHGDAIVAITGKLVTVDFEGVITTAGSVQRQYDVGIQVANLRSINAYIPEFRVENSGIIHYFNSDGTINRDYEGYAGDALVDGSINGWNFGRMYTPEGGLGVWSDSIYAVGLRITGRLYGTL